MGFSIALFEFGSCFLSVSPSPNYLNQRDILDRLGEQKRDGVRRVSKGTSECKEASEFPLRQQERQSSRYTSKCRRASSYKVNRFDWSNAAAICASTQSDRDLEWTQCTPRGGMNFPIHVYHPRLHVYFRFVEP